MSTNVTNQKSASNEALRNELHCSTCGKQTSLESLYCSSCGSVLASTVTNIKELMRQSQRKKSNGLNLDSRFVLSVVSLLTIWMSIVVSSLFAPDLISGSQQEHLPLVSWTIWLWGLVGSVFAIRMYREDVSESVFKFQNIVVMMLWAVVTVVCVFAPTFVTGSDPTSIPFASLIAPLIGSFLTAGVWFLGKPPAYY